MLRKKLSAIEGNRKTFIGTFSRFGLKPGWKGRQEETVLILDVRDADSGDVMCDHLWLNLTEGFRTLHLTEGDRITFAARVKPYVKGYQGSRAERTGEAWVSLDWKLSHPTRIEKIE